MAKLSEYVAPLVFGTTRADSSLSNDAVIQAMGPLIQLPMDYWTNLSNSPGTSRSNTPNIARNPSQRSNHGSQTSIRVFFTFKSVYNFHFSGNYHTNQTAQFPTTSDIRFKWNRQYSINPSYPPLFTHVLLQISTFEFTLLCFILILLIFNSIQQSVPSPIQ